MKNSQVADKAGDQGDGVPRREKPPRSGDHPPPPFGGQLLQAGLVVVAGGKKLMLGDAQGGADGGDHGHVRVGQRPLPLAYGGLCDKQLLRQLLLGQTRLQPFFSDVLTEGFFLVHVWHSPLLGCASTLRRRRENVKALRPKTDSTVRKVGLYQRFEGCAPFLNTPSPPGPGCSPHPGSGPARRR